MGISETPEGLQNHIEKALRVHWELGVAANLKSAR